MRLTPPGRPHDVREGPSSPFFGSPWGPVELVTVPPGPRPLSLSFPHPGSGSWVGPVAGSGSGSGVWSRGDAGCWWFSSVDCRPPRGFLGPDTTHRTPEGGSGGQSPGDRPAPRRPSRVPGVSSPLVVTEALRRVPVDMSPRTLSPMAADPKVEFGG